MTKEQETLKYLSAMRVIDYDKLGFVYGKETIDEVLNLIQQLQEENEQLKNILDERFIYVTGARTVYSRLMSLDKEIIVKDDLKLRNEIKQHILESEKKDKIIDKMAEWIFDKDYTTNSLSIDRDDYYSNCIKQVKQYFQKKVSEE